MRVGKFDHYPRFRFAQGKENQSNVRKDVDTVSVQNMTFEDSGEAQLLHIRSTQALNPGAPLLLAIVPCSIE